MNPKITPKNPQLSVIMPVYNAGPHLAEAIESILKQTFTDYELIIINDGSTDNTADIIGRIKDRRVRVMSQKNRGLVASLNRGIKASKGRYVARMDADDISLPHRFSKQMSYLSHNKEVVLLGSSYSEIDHKSNRGSNVPVIEDDGDLRREMYFKNPFGHGTTMMKVDAVKQAGGYDQAYWPAEDYDLWRRLAKLGKIANINEVLYLYRLNQDGISAQNLLPQAKKVDLIRKEIWSRQQYKNESVVGVLRSLRSSDRTNNDKKWHFRIELASYLWRPHRAQALVNIVALVLPDIVRPRRLLGMFKEFRSNLYQYDSN